MKQCFGEPESSTVSDVRDHDEANGGWTRMECMPDIAPVDANNIEEDRDSLEPATAHEDITLPPHLTRLYNRYLSVVQLGHRSKLTLDHFVGISLKL